MLLTGAFANLPLSWRPHRPSESDVFISTVQHSKRQPICSKLEFIYDKSRLSVTQLTIQQTVALITHGENKSQGTL